MRDYKNTPKTSENLDALVKAYSEIDQSASVTARAYFINKQVVKPSEMVSLHMAPRRFDDSDPRMISSHNYSGLGRLLFDEAAIKDKEGDLTTASHLKAGAHELMAYATALGNIRAVPSQQSLVDFTRKSVVGAGYRVGASFTLDAIYLTAAGAIGYYLAKKAGLEESVVQSASDFIKNLDPAKLVRVAAAVVLINFADYKWDITNRLDTGAKWMSRKIKSLFTRKKY